MSDMVSILLNILCLYLYKIYMSKDVSNQRFFVVVIIFSWCNIWKIHLHCFFLWLCNMQYMIIFFFTFCVKFRGNLVSLIVQYSVNSVRYAAVCINTKKWLLVWAYLDSEMYRLRKLFFEDSGVTLGILFRQNSFDSWNSCFLSITVYLEKTTFV